MELKYLFGPVDREYSEENLAALRASGQCRTFGWNDGDVRIRPSDAGAEIQRWLQADWQPDFIALFLGYTHIPPALWKISIPIVGLAPDWHLLWHRYRFALPRCDLVFTDTAGAARLRRAGYRRAIPGNLFGCGRSLLECGWPKQPRDIDVLFVGSLHPAEQRERLSWIARLAQTLGQDWRVVIRTDARGDVYRSLLARARIVFNRSVRGECNLRTFEAAAAGALLFQEAGNHEVPRFFRHRQECVFYTAANLGSLLAHYLEHEEDRCRVATAAQQRVAYFGFPALWEEILDQIRRRRSSRARRASRRTRQRTDSRHELMERSWESLACHTGPDRNVDPEPSLIRDLQTAAAMHCDPARWHNALGLACARQLQRQGSFTRVEIAAVLPHFRKAVEHDPTDALFRLNLAEALRGAGCPEEAAEHAESALRTLAASSGLSDDAMNSGHFPPAYDFFRVEWERAAWRHAGSKRSEQRAKRRLLRWRLHALLGDITGELSHYRKAVALRPDLWTTQADLGQALIKQGRFADAVDHLRRATDANPFDAALRDELARALCEAHDFEGHRALAAAGLTLERAAPRITRQKISYTHDGRP